MRENSATVLSTVPLPAGVDAASTWDDWDFQCRVIWTRSITVVSTVVAGSGIQLPNGTIDAGVDEPPLVMVGESQFTTAQARELAAAIVATANLIDGWVR